MIMTRKYQNTDFKTGASTFVDTIASNPETQAQFTAANVNATVNGVKVPMSRGKLTLRQAASSTVCGVDCPISITESVAIEFHVGKGAANFSALRAEANRLFDLAEQEYGLTRGLVPPVYASFSEE